MLFGQSVRTLSLIPSPLVVKRICDELQSVVDQRFSSIDLGDQVILSEPPKRIGFGGYGDVYAGTHNQTKVAVKVLIHRDINTLPVFKVSNLFAFSTRIGSWYLYIRKCSMKCMSGPSWNTTTSSKYLESQLSSIKRYL